jgi:hypothetical protein
MTKLQISLTDEETALLQNGADNLGYSLTRFVKFLLGQKAMELNQAVPTFNMSDKLEKRVEKAMKNFRAGDVVKVNHLSELLEKNANNS